MTEPEKELIRDEELFLHVMEWIYSDTEKNAELSRIIRRLIMGVESPKEHFELVDEIRKMVEVACKQELQDIFLSGETQEDVEDQENESVVSYLHEVVKSSFAWDVPRMLDVCKQDIETGERVANRGLVIMLDDTEDNYSIGYAVSKMKYSDCIALMEVVKTYMIREMGYT